MDWMECFGDLPHRRKNCIIYNHHLYFKPQGTLLFVQMNISLSLFDELLTINIMSASGPDEKV